MAFQIGEYFLSGPYVYQVDRLTKHRAYVHRVQGIDLRHSGQDTSIVLGGEKSGAYIEWMADFQIGQHERNILRLPVSTDDEAIRLAITARSEMGPFARAISDAEAMRRQNIERERAALLSVVARLTPADDAA